MDITTLAAAFAQKYVSSELRDRFLHELLKQPKKLPSRLCHKIKSIFDDCYKNRLTTFRDTNWCYVFDGGKTPQRITWADASQYFQRGDSILIIDENNNTFNAEAETTQGHTHITYAPG